MVIRDGDSGRFPAGDFVKAYRPLTWYLRATFYTIQCVNLWYDNALRCITFHTHITFCKYSNYNTSAQKCVQPNGVTDVRTADTYIVCRLYYIMYIILDIF